MASLKEIKNRIESVNGTLKITSAMKMVAAAKLHKAQMAIGNMLPYEDMLHRMLANLIAYKRNEEHRKDLNKVLPDNDDSDDLDDELDILCRQREVSKVAIVAYSSNSSLCGAFNSSIIKHAFQVVDEYLQSGLKPSDITVYSVGKKMADAMKKKGYASPADYSHLSEKPTYEEAASLAAELVYGYMTGRYDKIELLYNHFRSASSQPVKRDAYLPLSIMPIVGHNKESDASYERGWKFDYIVEPDVNSVLEDLLPKVMAMKIYTVQLDTNAAEHAARTVAMQTATDNGNDILQEITIEYNKGRQQKITNELLDIVAGSSS